MVRKATDRSERIALIFAFGLALLLPATQALAQAGSTGGNVGLQGKSVSGGESAAPSRQKATRQKASKQRASAPRHAARAPVETESRSGGASIHGLWRWSAACERGQRNYSGTMTIEESGSGLKLSHGGTNFWDGGTITNVRYTGSQLSFDRQFVHFRDHMSLAIARGGARMSGVLPNTEHSGRCQVSFVKS